MGSCQFGCDEITLLLIMGFIYEIPNVFLPVALSPWNFLPVCITPIFLHTCIKFVYY